MPTSSPSAEVGAGSFDLFGNRQTGVNLDGKSRSTGQPGAPLLVITGRAGVGEIIVRRGYEPFTQQALRTGQPVPLQCEPTGKLFYATGSSGLLRCAAADGVTPIPALACVVAEHGSALCRPPGEPEPAADFGDAPGTRRCQVAAGAGEATCGPPNPGAFPNPGRSGHLHLRDPLRRRPSRVPPDRLRAPPPAPTRRAPATPPAPAAPADPGPLRRRRPRRRPPPPASTSAPCPKAAAATCQPA